MKDDVVCTVTVHCTCYFFTVNSMRSKYRKRATGQTPWGWMTYLSSHRRYMIDYCQLSARQASTLYNTPACKSDWLTSAAGCSSPCHPPITAKRAAVFHFHSKERQDKNRAKRRLTTFQMVDMNLRRITLSALSFSLTSLGNGGGIRRTSQKIFPMFLATHFVRPG